MSVEMIWDDPSETIMLCTSHGRWTWDEYHETLTEIVDQFKRVDHRVDLIITRSGSSIMPSGSPMPHFQRAMRIMPANVGLVLLVNTSGFSRALVSMFSRVFASKANPVMIIVGSVEEARSKIALNRVENTSRITS